MIPSTMELSEAIRKAAQILDEERIRPTVAYQPQPSSQDLGVRLIAAFDVMKLREERQARPRPVHESPDEFKFASTNYELLLSLFSQVSVNERSAFVGFLLTYVPEPASPLVAEFSIRTGCTAQLVRAVGESVVKPGLVLLLKQLQDTVALNFNVFSDEQLEELTSVLGGVRVAAERKTYTSSGIRGGKMTPNPEYDAKAAPVAKEVVAACDCLMEECGQARYWYLKGALQQNANLEINQDKAKVEDYLKRLGFSGPLLQTLSVAEQDFRASATPFELKNCLAHLRSFLEGLHEQACKPIAAQAGTTAPRKWAKSTQALRDEGILSLQQENFARTLYTLISDEGVHPLIAEREYARLLRNMAIEYGLFFLLKLEKAGIKVE